MVRVIESAEDEDRGWGTKKSPYEFDPNIQDSIQDSVQDSIQDSRIQDAIRRQPSVSNPTQIQDIQRTKRITTSPPKERLLREFGDIGDLMDIPQPGEVMKGLVPIGDSGFYSVPDEAAKPNDCERWPDSPACTGQPFSLLPIGYEDQEIVSDECNIGFGITPVVGFIKLPKIQVVYRKPECRDTPEDYSEQKEWDFYDAPPHFKSIPFTPRPRSCVPKGYDFYCWVGISVECRYFSRRSEKTNINGGGTGFYMSALRSYNKISLPIENAPPIQMFNIADAQHNFERVPQITCTFTGSVSNQFAGAVTGFMRRFDWPHDHRETQSHADDKGRCYFERNDWNDFDADGYITFARGREAKYLWQYEIYISGGDYTVPTILYGQYSKIVRYLETVYKPVIRIDNYGDERFSYKNYSRTDYGCTIAWIKVDGTNELIIPDCPRKNKPPEEKRKKCCMGCCPPSPGDDGLLRAVLKAIKEVKEDVENLKKRVGDPVDVKYHEEKSTDKIKDFGFDSKSYKPDTLFKAAEFAVNRVDYVNKQLIRLKENNAVLQPKEFIDAKIPKRLLYPAAKGEEKLRGLSDVLKCMILQIDRAVGLWPLDIKVADANAGKEGSQPVTLKIQSISDGLKTLIESAIDVNADVDTSTNMMVRLAYEAMATHQIVAVNNQYLENIEDAFGYKVKHTKLDLPLAFNPNGASGKGFEKGGKGNLDANTEAETERLLPKLLQETIYSVKATEYDGKKDLNESMLEILHHVLTISGTTTTPYKGPGALKQMIESAVFAQKMIGHLMKQNVQEAVSGGDLERVLKEIEQGYETIAPDRTEFKSPYNRPMKERPKAKRVSKRKNQKKVEPPTPKN